MIFFHFHIINERLHNCNGKLNRIEERKNKKANHTTVFKPTASRLVGQRSYCSATTVALQHPLLPPILAYCAYCAKYTDDHLD